MVLFVKLFAIMGLTWFTECVHVVLHDHDHSYSDYCNFYVEASHSILSRMFNCRKGLSICDVHTSGERFVKKPNFTYKWYNWVA